MGSPRSSRAQVEERLEKVEEMLCAGIAPGRVERSIAKDYGVTPRQARKYIATVYRRWQAQTVADAPHRREKMIRMAERFYAKCIAKEQYTAAARALAMLMQASGAFAMHDPARDAKLAELGAPPLDPTQALIWGQRCLVLQLEEVMRNPAVDPERKVRLVGDLVAKLGLIFPRVLVEQKLEHVAKQLDGTQEPIALLTALGGIERPSTARRPGGGPSDSSGEVDGGGDDEDLPGVR